MGGTIRTCVVCGAPMGNIPGDICCRREDEYLLLCCKGHMREFEDRECNIDQVTELLYDDLAEFLENQGRDIEDYEASSVMSELERRVLRWINKKMMHYRALTGYAFCVDCGTPILAGRTRCADCSSSNEVGGLTEDSSFLPTPKKPIIGMRYQH